MLKLIPLLALIIGASFSALTAQDGGDAPKKETWDYAPTIQAISKKFTGTAGKVVPMGDSITYANQAGKWARYGTDRTPDQLAVAKWMNASENDNRNGWWLAANDQPDNRSWTAASGITAEDYLNGGFHGLPSLDAILAEHKPQIALIMLGTNDLKHGVPTDKYLENMRTFCKKCMDAGTVPVVCSVIPTTWTSIDNIKAYNAGLYKMTESLKLPFCDLFGEFLKVRPNDTWKETLISADGAHPTYDPAEGPATEENLKKCGYLLKCFVQCNKVGEIKAKMKW